MPETAEEKKGFEDILDALNEIIEKLEKGNLPLDESIALYTKGVGMLQTARGVLKDAQARLEVLMSAGSEGQPRIEESDPDEFLEKEE